MAEAVRLVVWDLDETFWRGTLTEGGIREYVQAHHDLVIELARRGIISSICSKNDMDTVLPILREKGILEYFVFPSVSWESKGQRLAALVETVGLRPTTVLFIDDNPNNRAEAAAIVPGLQIEDETFIARMLDDSRFKGKDDKDLTRLKQYQLLEARKRDEQRADGGNEAFLRGCDVRVYIEYDVASHIDRAVELVNRTNQLNYTKRRLPENPDKARRLLQDELASYNRQAGLVRVMDKYGDYGFVGLFVTETMRKENVPGAANSRLRHYCFSCRTLGMLIEYWLYEHLRRPELTVVGEVLTDLSVPRIVDWVRLVPSMRQDAPRQEPVAPKLVLWGGCEVNAVALYLAGAADSVDVFGNYPAGALFVRINSAVLALELTGRDPAGFAAEAALLGLPEHMNAVDIFGDVPPGTAYVFNCTFDSSRIPLYRHRTRGWVLHAEPQTFSWMQLNVVPEARLVETMAEHPHLTAEQQDQLLRVRRHIAENYVNIRPVSEAGYADAMRGLIDRVPNGSRFIIALDHDEVCTHDKQVVRLPQITRYAAIMREVAAEYPYVGVVSFADVLQGPHEIQKGGGNHYDRHVYLRFAERVIEVLRRLPARSNRTGASSSVLRAAADCGCVASAPLPSDARFPALSNS